MRGYYDLNVLKISNSEKLQYSTTSEHRGRLEGGEGIVVVNSVTNCSTTARERMRDVFAQFIS